MANVLQNKGDLDGALSMYQEALVMKKQLLGDVHPDVGTWHGMARYGVVGCGLRVGW